MFLFDTYCIPFQALVHWFLSDRADTLRSNDLSVGSQWGMERTRLLDVHSAGYILQDFYVSLCSF